MAGLGMAGIGVAGKSSIMPALAQDRPLTPTFYQWIQDLHPGIPKVNEKFPDVNYQIAPVEGFGIERFVAEAKNKESTWDVYVGQTPFVEMSAMIKADVIEPWDNYIPKDVLDDMIPSIRAEGTIDGKLYGWPFLLDVIGNSWHSGITGKAGLADKAPETWDEHLANAKAIVDSKAAPFGAVFDDRGWRSLAPMTHSMNPDVYTAEGLFNFESEAAIEALKLMKKILRCRRRTCCSKAPPMVVSTAHRTKSHSPRSEWATTPSTSTRRCAWRNTGTIQKPCDSAHCPNLRMVLARLCSGPRVVHCSSTARTRKKPPNM
ncbi:MAG: extracellular solute-binding protein [Rhizobiales bacterium]|nr:extracellular solute-binding protein [Hyphomicrobiales bacterium]